MRPMTVTQLTRHLFGAADILRSRMDASAYLDIISGMLLLKRASDQPDILQMPDRARWSRIVKSEHRMLGDPLNVALLELERSNLEVLDGVLEGLDFNKRGLGRAQLKSLIDHFDRISLSDNDLEFRDVVGCAYDRVLGWFAERAGRRAEESYTPRSVVRLMVRLVRPEPGQSVYDPFAGSGGMLVQAKKYVDEHSAKSANLTLFGQEINISTWSIARLNLLLHSITEGSLLRGDSLTNPLHVVADGRRMLFDRVLTNPPFSMNYVRQDVRYPERMRYGWTPEQGNKADLMNVQHALAMMRPDGIGAVVTPQGVLFRGGVEAEIRRGILEDGRLEGVIGIGPNVFYGTAIPACILVLRGTNGSPAERRDRVLFINAEREIVTGRTQNRLEPQHIEKILDVFRNWSEIPGFSRVVSLDEIAENDFNLNVRRYVHTSPPAGPLLDVRAALFGGVPKREVDAQESKFHVFGIDPADLFQPKNPDYLDFPAEGYEATAERIQHLTTGREQQFIDRCQRWWERAARRIAEHAGTRLLLRLRSRLMTSFCEELLPPGILDRYQLIGIFAAWWSDRQDDLRSLDHRGFPGVIDRWTTTNKELSRPVPEHVARERVLGVLGEDIRSRVEKLVAAERQALVDVYLSWGDRYATSLVDLETQSEAAAARLRHRMGELGYTWTGPRPSGSRTHRTRR
ncbi:MAG: N-6 DNA methylase [Streptosporangiales bacterium]|nr:N-6 DNA methylase [Streptosporangiales bacterium]